MPRPTKLTPEVQEKLVQAIRTGATYALACKYAGIHYETFRVWMSTKPAFSVAIKEAEGQAAVGWLARIEIAAQEGAWQAAAWKLERRYPEEYGRQIVDHNHTHRIMLGEIERIAAEEGWDDSQKAAAVKEAERIMAGQE